MKAARREPQTVTKRGKPAVIVVDVSEYARLKRLELLGAAPFSEHLLAMPTDDGDFARLEGEPREPDVP